MGIRQAAVSVGPLASLDFGGEQIGLARKDHLRDINRYYHGKFLVEHVPGDSDGEFQVYDLRLIFDSNNNAFCCRTLAEAETLCETLYALDFKRA